MPPFQPLSLAANPLRVVLRTKHSFGFWSAKGAKQVGDLHLTNLHLFDKCQLSEGPMTKPGLLQNQNVCKRAICAPSQAKPQSLRPSCSCVSGPLALCTSSHAIKVHRAINTMDFLSDQPCVTRATYSLFRGANLEKGAISDCMVCTK